MNHLKQSLSLYLQQHGDNPVDWYEWGEEAFNRAIHENKPIFLSIGYSACHWCHVLNKESFSDEKIAQELNAYFICIKVDKEEYPEVDSLYMQLAQALMGQPLGWPLNLFLTPERKPFFAFSYLPPYSEAGFEGSMSDLITQIQLLWAQGGRTEIEARAKALIDAFQKLEEVSLTNKLPDHVLAKKAYQELMRNADISMGGFLPGQKFPGIPILQFLLKMGHFFYLPHAKEHVFLTLTKMSEGSLFDHVEGGFFRYCIDENWSIPHFEKMAEDQAMNVLCLVEAWQESKNSYFSEVAIKTLNFCMETLIADDGGVYSALAASNHGKEGIYYTFTIEELKKYLSEFQFERIKDLFLLESCKLNGRYILHQSQSFARYAQEKGLSSEELKQKVNEDLQALKKARKQKTPPIRDEKKCSYLSALLGKAFLYGWLCFDDKRYLNVARKCFSFIQEVMFQNGNLHHVAFGSKVTHLANLQDLSSCLDFTTMMSSYTVDKQALKFAFVLANQMIKMFSAPKGGFYFTDVRDTSLIVRKKEYFDSATPAAQSVAILGLQRLAMLSGNNSYLNEAKQALLAASFHIESAVPFFSILGSALIHQQLAKITVPKDLEIKALHELFQHFLSEVVFIPHEFAIESMKQDMAKYGASEILFCKGDRCYPPIKQISEISKLFEVNNDKPKDW